MKRKTIKGKPVKKLVKTANAAIGKGSNSFSFSGDTFEEDDKASFDEDEEENAEGKPVKKLVKAVQAAMCNGSNSVAPSGDTSDEDDQASLDEDAEEHAEGKPVKKHVKAVRAAMGNGSNSFALLDDIRGNTFVQSPQVVRAVSFDDDDEASFDEDGEETDEGKPVEKQVKAVKTAMGNVSNSFAFYDDIRGNTFVQSPQGVKAVSFDDDDTASFGEDEEENAEGKPVEKLVKAVNAAMGTGSNSFAIFDDIRGNTFVQSPQVVKAVSLDDDDKASFGESRAPEACR